MSKRHVSEKANVPSVDAGCEATEEGAHQGGQLQQQDAEALSAVSHELRNPLNGILGTIELFRRTELCERQQKLIATLATSAQMMLSTLDGLKANSFKALDVTSTPETPQTQNTIKSVAGDVPETFHVWDRVEEVVASQLDDIRARGLEVSVFISTSFPDYLRGDRQAWEDVQQNALKYAIGCAPEGVLSISAVPGKRSTSSAEVRFIIQMPVPIMQASATDQGPSCSDRPSLDEIRKQADRAGGRFDFYRSTGSGVSFEFVKSFEVVTAESDDEGDRDLQNARVLIVSSSETDRQIAASYLAACGANVSTVVSGWEALDLISEPTTADSPFALIVIDDEAHWDDQNFDFQQALESAAAPAAPPGLVLLCRSDVDDTDADADSGNVALIGNPIRRKRLESVSAQLIENFLIRSQGPEGAASAIADGANDDATQVYHSNVVLPLSAHILVAEDIAVNQVVMTELLAELGCTVEIANNGAEAVNAFEKKLFDIVLMDCQMPEMDGLTATQQIREIERHNKLSRTPIIGVSAHVFETERARFLGSGKMDDFLCKPFSMDQLEKSIRDALEPATAIREHAAAG